ncbi:MAG: hypothetical protein JNM94_14225 [Phycisphaerae bacterium]|nr:hypothetical protein [Phycisphaerae bacterium]
MNGLTNYLSRYLSDEVTRILGSPAGREARPIFRGLPGPQMEELLSSLGGQAGLRVAVPSGAEQNVPVFLVASVPTNPVGLASGKCTDSHLLRVRNNPACHCFLTLLPPGSIVNESISSSAIYLGVDPALDRSDLSDDPFVTQLIEHALGNLAWTGEQRDAARRVVEQALTDAARLDIGAEDRDSQWGVIERLFEIVSSPAPTPRLLLAALGFPPCASQELGTKQHVGVLERVGQELESQGFSTAFGTWASAAPDLQEALTAAQSFLRENSGDGPTFARSPSSWYRLPISEVLSGSVPAWWDALTLARWDELLHSDVVPDKALRVSAAGALVEASSGLPILFQETAAFNISVGEDEPDGAVVKISVSRGTKDFTALGEVTLSGRAATFTDETPPDHQSPLRYQFEADGYTAFVVRAIVLDRYAIGIVVHSRSAIKHSLFKKAKKAKGEQECDIEFPGVGSHHVDILHGRHVVIGDRITGHDTSAESNEPQERPINKSGDTSAATLIQTDDESLHEFTAEVRGDQVVLRLFVRASDAPPVGAASEFDRLILEHRSAVRRGGGAARVEPAACRANDLEHWLLEDPDSFHPLVLGEDYLEAWAAPEWRSRPKLSAVPMQHDPRPEPEAFQPPKAYVAARSALQAALTQGSSADEVVETVSIGERMRDEAFRNLVTSYLDEYAKWLKQDYDSAVWADLVTVHRLDPNGAALHPYPQAILLTPLHPIRFGWQAVAQALLQHAIDHRLRCPAASILDPRSTPDCLVLPCRTPVGKIAPRVFLSVASSSDYWGVLWSGEGDQLRALDDEAGRLIFDQEFGITIDGLASGFSVPQVERAIDEMAQIWSAKSTLRVSVTSDTRGSSSCNEGIFSWARKALAEQDPWRYGGGKSLEVYDERGDDLQPEDAELSTLTQVLDSSIRWYSRPTPSPHADLAIIAHLGTQSPELDRQGLYSPIDAVGLNRVRVRRQLAASDGKFIAESRVGKHESSPDTVEALPEVARSTSAQLASLVQAIEGRCADTIDSYVFMPKKPTLEKAVDAARYCAVSSTNVDPACFFTVSDKSYLWDYDLPSYSRRAGENSGFYLIANESPTIRHAAQSAIKDLQRDAVTNDATISRLLREISRRGVPTLKRLTGGGTASLGEIGVLTCLRTLQCEFAETSWPCVFPVRTEGSPLVNLVIPVDPFHAFFDELRQGLQLQDFERPDLISISLRFEGDQLAAMKVTPIEVKARADAMGDSQLRDAIEQARIFARFLEQLAKRASEHAIWGIAHRHLIASWLDYAFRVYGQLRNLMESTDWHKCHGEVLAAILSGRIVPEVDSQGRLFVVGTDKESEKRDLDRDGLNEMLLISHADAYAILTDPAKKVPERLRNVVGDWQLSAQARPPAASHQPDPAPPSPPPAPTARAAPVPAAGSSKELAPPQAIPSKPAPTSDSPPAAVGYGVRFAVGNTVATIEPHDRFFHPSNTALNQMNIGIVGDLGVGKTQLVQALIYQLRRDPAANRGRAPNVFILDYKKDYSKKEFVEATGARVVKPEHIPLNLFDIRDAPDSNKAWLHRARCFIDILSRVYSGIGPVQQERLKSAVKDAYATASAQSLAAPTLYGVFDAYTHIIGDKLDAPYSIMSNMVDMELFTRDPAAVLPFSEFFSGPVVVDLGYLQDDDKTKNVVVAIMLNLFFAYMLSREKKPFLGTDPQLRYVDSFLLVDEANNIMQYEFDVLKKLLLQGREFGIGIMLASQYLSHFRTANEDYREPLLTWFVHKVPNLSVKDLVGIGLTNVDQSVVDRVKGLANHQCLYKTFDVAGEVIRAKPFYELVARG